ncbi:MAG: hypothetical protein D3904_07455 [Candidatus Electrothrix sp. EH2]|nr:hypothetical protein [Candidatus Electrothrix sp. EH2]
MNGTSAQFFFRAWLDKGRGGLFPKTFILIFPHDLAVLLSIELFLDVVHKEYSFANLTYY